VGRRTSAAQEPLALLLRGVNIGNRRVRMADLVAGLSDRGCENVRSYVQSGNLVLVPPPPSATGADVHGWLGRTITELCGFDVTLVSRTSADLRGVIDANPFPEAGGAQLHVTFFHEAPDDPFLGIDAAAFAPESAIARGREVYLHLPNGMGRSPLAKALTAQRYPPHLVATTRNWNTIAAVAELLATTP
jgi:uncharacterized protein (DUF1697 family)